MKTKARRPEFVQEPPAGYDSPVIAIYESPEGVRVDVKLAHETVWLTQKQMAELFDTDRSVITKHLRNIFKSLELIKDSVSAFFAHTASDGKIYKTTFYNLDAVISVGYRVNSKRGTQFRIWATRILHDHLLKGYTANERRLNELNQAIRLIADVTTRRPLTGDEATALLRVVADYSFALDLLDAYDNQTVSMPLASQKSVSGITVQEARRAVAKLRESYRAGSLFGLERDQILEGSLNAVLQTYKGRDLYSSLEEKAASLLYFLVKDHPFIDGNKRIAASLFLWFLEKNDALYHPDGAKRIADTALVAMTLLIAESRPDEKEILTLVLVNLIGRKDPFP